MSQATVHSVVRNVLLLLLLVLMSICNFLRLSLFQRVIVLPSSLKLIFLDLFLLIIRRRVASPFIRGWHFRLIFFLLERLVRLCWRRLSPITLLAKLC